MTINHLFLFYLKYIWPIQKHFVKRTKRCPNCLLKFTNGLCNECNIYVKDDTNINNHYDSFKEMIYEHINSGNRYDAILFLSGGKDSSYMLQRIKHEFTSLNLLCVLVNNGFMSDYALSNAKSASSKCHTDLMVANEYQEDFRVALRIALLEAHKHGCYSTVDYADGKLMTQVGINIASDLGIKMAFMGLTKAQVDNILKLDTFYEIVNGVKLMYPMSIWDPSESEVHNEAKSLIGETSSILSNNKLVPTMMAVDMKNLGYFSFEKEFSQLIREGKADRDFWVNVCDLGAFFTRWGFLNKEMKTILDKLDLSVSEVIK